MMPRQAVAGASSFVERIQNRAVVLLETVDEDQRDESAVLEVVGRGEPSEGLSPPILFALDVCPGACGVSGGC